MKIFDLTHIIENGMMIYPGDPSIEILEGLVHEKDYCHVDRLHLNSHTGTHIDAPFHFLKEGSVITDYPADKFVCKGISVDLTYKKDGEAITAEDLIRGGVDDHFTPGACILLTTGWYRYFDSERYLHHPYISKEAAEYLVEKGATIVAVDFLNVDQTLVEAWDAHPVLLGNNTLIVENVNNSLDLEFKKEYLFSFLPLKVKGSDGSPVRAVAMEL